MGFGSFTLGFAGISDEANRNAKAQARLLDRARKTASTDRFISISERITPLIRELEAMGAIPAFQQAAATGVARRGLTGTGLGTAITTAGGGAGELFALKEALGLSSDLQARQLSALLGFAGVPLAGPSKSNLFGAATDVIMQRIASGVSSQGKNVQGDNPIGGTSPGGQQPFAATSSGSDQLLGGIGSGGGGSAGGGLGGSLFGFGGGP